ncbi:hypothetical protein LTR56_017814 [Elasticomyces elasticus]|nr:hypothetical protein LTR22_022033 [Elasticomyces elasticus]KAK3629801.1 hypothetical protein LTR56_017814 [Elasticomyces elasticus]KAK4917495.1 hypothetical protein LTR49_014581 [Elasticomyces elasticus]KAK5756381.1 hypothetical protein LTS12_013570 [Elasticomyces elasticus]
MSEHVDTREEDMLRGAQEFIEYLEQMAGEDGKDVEDVLAEEEEEKLRALKEGNPTGSEMLPKRSTEARAATKTVAKKAGVSKKAPAGPEGSVKDIQKNVKSTVRKCSIWPKASLSEIQEKTALEND